MTGRQGSLERLSHRWEGMLGRVIRASSSSRFAQRGRRFGRRRFFNFRHRRVLIGLSVVLVFLLSRTILATIFCSPLIITTGGDGRRRVASGRCDTVLKTDRSVESSMGQTARLRATHDSQLWRTRMRPVNIAQGGIVLPRVITAPKEKRQSRTGDVAALGFTYTMHNGVSSACISSGSGGAGGCHSRSLPFSLLAAACLPSFAFAFSARASRRFSRGVSLSPDEAAPSAGERAGEAEEDDGGVEVPGGASSTGMT